MARATFARCLASSLLCLTLAACGNASSATPDMLVLNADIWTMDESLSRASALAISHGLVSAVGSDAEIRSLAGEATRVLDLGGRTLVPGFNDAHMHPMMAFPGSVDLGVQSVNTMDALVSRLKKRAGELPAGEWVLGWNYDDEALGGHPTRTQLDQVSRTHPIMLTHSSGHVGTANSLAYEGAGIDRETADPTGGAFDRDASGQPTGVCREEVACELLYSERFPEPQRDLQGAITQLREAFERLHSLGITSIGDAYVTPELFFVYLLALNDDNPMRVNLMFIDEELTFAKWAARFQGLISWWSGGLIRVGPIKVFHGNSLSGHTCWLYEPYADRPDYYGVPHARSQGELNRLVKDVHDTGLQLAVHANGDREIDMVLDAIELALEDNPRADHRHRIEHASIMNENILERVKKLGVVLALHSYVYEHGEKMKAYGEYRYRWMHANRSALEAGIPLAGNSDYPISGAEVMLRLRSLMTRTSRQGNVYGVEQVLSAEQAIGTYTRGSAYASFEEDIKGQLKPGYVADFTVLSQNPAAVAAAAVSDIDILMTVLGGEVVYAKPGVGWAD